MGVGCFSLLESPTLSPRLSCLRLHQLTTDDKKNQRSPALSDELTDENTQSLPLENVAVMADTEVSFPAGGFFFPFFELTKKRSSFATKTIRQPNPGRVLTVLQEAPTFDPSVMKKKKSRKPVTFEGDDDAAAATTNGAGDTPVGIYTSLSSNPLPSSVNQSPSL